MNVPNDTQNGFSLVEVIVAMLVLTVGLVAMAASTGYIATQQRSTTWDTQRNLARQQVIEQLRSTIFTNVTTNTTGRSFGPYNVRWDVTNLASTERRVQLITTGPAYRQVGGSPITTVVDTAVIRIASPQ
jgi:prepilin-type N-terminal cleavage/methylation domain-containing protein